MAMHAREPSQFENNRNLGKKTENCHGEVGRRGRSSRHFGKKLLVAITLSLSLFVIVVLLLGSTLSRSRFPGKSSLKDVDQVDPHTPSASFMTQRPPKETTEEVEPTMSPSLTAQESPSAAPTKNGDAFSLNNTAACASVLKGDTLQQIADATVEEWLSESSNASEPSTRMKRASEDWLAALEACHGPLPTGSNDLSVFKEPTRWLESMRHCADPDRVRSGGYSPLFRGQFCRRLWHMQLNASMESEFASFRRSQACIPYRIYRGFETWHLPVWKNRTSRACWLV